MAEYLFLVTIGPVQEFIAAARRTRDLWLGSWLLSELSREAARTLAAMPGARLIFPGSADTLETHEVVNRIMAVLPYDHDISQVGEDVERAVQQHLGTIRNQTFQRIPGLQNQTIRTQAEVQIAELLELYWAAVPFTTTYHTQRGQLEALLTARKNTRDFAQPHYSGNVPKSSIDGQRESVIPETEYSRGLNDPERANKAAALFKNYGAGRAERLSGVDLLKRHGMHGHDQTDFPSTSHFAALPMLQRVASNYSAEAQRRWTEYLAVLKPLINLCQLDKQRDAQPIIGQYDASLLFEERLAELAATEAQRTSAVRALRAFLEAFTGGKPPEPYYALLHADGDNMGKVIDALAQQGIERHQLFSQALDAFASSVKATVESAAYRGRLIYAGGDDVLAFLPLDTALGCANALAAQFRAAMQAFTVDASGTPTAPTLSAGLVIAHHIEPLSDALNLVRQAEKAAKRLPGKDALAIILSKRSGADTLISGKWLDGFITRLQAETEAHQRDSIPDGAAYDLRDLDQRLTHGGNQPNQQLLVAEALRILARKRGQHGQKNAAETFETLLETIQPALQAGRHTRDIANELIVAREFARARGIVKK